MIPRRPAWRDSDPCWRRRMLAGAWVLVLIPLMAVLKNFEWTSTIVVPTPFEVVGPMTLQDTFATWTYEYLTFCIGVVLLFSHERNRRPAPLDWTRRWGVTASYGVFLLGVVPLLFFTALVTIGVAAVFNAMPLRNQPATTGLLANVGANYLHFGPLPGQVLQASLPALSAIVILLACVPLYNALRSSGPALLGILLLAPLCIGSVLLLSDIARRRLLDQWDIRGYPVNYNFYFGTNLLVNDFPSSAFRFGIEVAKWSACFGIATWLSVAQWRSRKHVTAEN